MIPGVAALGLFAIAVGIVAYYFREIAAFFGMIGTLADHPTDRQAFLGFAAFGLSLVAILAVLKIVLASQNNRR